MSQLTASLPLQPSKKNKLLVALGIVAIGHAGLLFALNQMKPMQLKPVVQPKPIQIRIITPPQPKVEPPKPVQPPKPKEVKIVDTPPPPPKKVEKIEQVKKEVVKPKVVAPPKPIPIAPPTPVVTPVVTETITPPAPVVVPDPTPIAPPTPPAPAAPPAPPAPPQPSVDMTPRNLGDGAGVAWKRSPKPKLVASDLDKVTNNVVILRIDVDAKGKIKANIVQSSGNPKVDREMVRAVQAAQFQPYKENGVAVPFYAEQPFRVQ